ncbi:MAG: FAD:protein FMN transferase [Candidatus Eiseniibacteriota bacterium]
MSGSATRTLRGARGALLLTIACTACSSGAAKHAVHDRTDFVLGTVAELKVVCASAEEAARALQRAYDELSRIERLASAYIDTSEVGRLALDPSAPLSADTREILRVAREVQDASGGAFCPTLGALLKIWGFPEPAALPDSASVREGVRLSRLPNAALDLGGIAKGYAVDLAAGALAETGSCIVTAGGDLAVRGTRPDGKAWLIGVQDPRDTSRFVVKLRVSGKVSVSTSGDYQRFLMVDGVRYHHILDPSTGWPARGLRSVTVIGPSAVLTDAWSTAAFVLGAQEGLARLEAHPDLEGMLVEEDGAGRLVLHRTSGFSKYEEPNE